MDLNTPINIRQLSFAYPEELQPALQQIDLSVPAGSRFGLFGPNGAGKTTLMNCVSGILTAEEGKISVFGSDAASETAKRMIGVVPQDFAFYHELNALENLRYFGSMYGMSPETLKARSRELLELLSLSRVASKPLYQLSGGYKRRVNLAIGVLHDPRLLILDEPTVGVDVQTRRDIIRFLKNLNAAGTSIFYTSHQLNEAEELCDEIALISNGRIIARDRLETLLRESGQRGLEELFILKTGAADE